VKVKTPNLNSGHAYLFLVVHDKRAKWLSLLLAAVLCPGLAGCDMPGSSTSTSQASPTSGPSWLDLYAVAQGAMNKVNRDTALYEVDSTLNEGEQCPSEYRVGFIDSSGKLTDIIVEDSAPPSVRSVSSGGLTTAPTHQRLAEFRAAASLIKLSPDDACAIVLEHGEKTGYKQGPDIKLYIDIPPLPEDTQPLPPNWTAWFYYGPESTMMKWSFLTQDGQIADRKCMSWQEGAGSECPAVPTVTP